MVLIGLYIMVFLILIGSCSINSVVDTLDERMNRIEKKLEVIQDMLK